MANEWSYKTRIWIIIGIIFILRLFSIGNSTQFYDISSYMFLAGLLIMLLLPKLSEFRIFGLTGKSKDDDKTEEMLHSK